MNIHEPKSFIEFFEIFDEYYSNVDNYYRCQADSTWEIIPSLARKNKLKVINPLLGIENKLIKKFQQYIKKNKLEFLIPQVNGCDYSWTLVMAAQHYGLPTRLLDFSFDKIIALLFAVADIQYINTDGALIIYQNPGKKQKDFSFLNNIFTNVNDESYFIPAPILMNKEKNELRLSERRKFIQASRFLYRDNKNIFECLSKDREHADSLIKIIIPKELKLEFIKEFIKNEKMVYDLFAGKNELDYYAAILKSQFSKFQINSSSNSVSKFKSK